MGRTHLRLPFLRSSIFAARWSGNDNGFSQLLVNVVTAVFDGNHAAALQVRNDGDGLTGITAQGKQKCIQFFVIGVDLLDDVLLALICVC